MYCYVWKYIDTLTANYHPSGGVMVVAEDFEHAWKVLDDKRREEWPDWEKAQFSSLGPLPTPDFVARIEATEPVAFIFPDAGCC